MAPNGARGPVAMLRVRQAEHTVERVGGVGGVGGEAEKGVGEGEAKACPI